MTPTQPPTQPQHLLTLALERLATQTGFPAGWERAVAEIGGPGYLPEGKARLVIGKKTLNYHYEYQANVDRTGIIHRIKARLGDGPEPGLLLTPFLTPELARQCRAVGLQFLDGAGNAYLTGPGVYIHIAGEKRAEALPAAEPGARAFDRTGLKLVFALVTRPDLLRAPYRELARIAGVALGTVVRVIKDLKEHGLLVEGKGGARHWVDRLRVIELWANNYPLRLRPKLHPRRFRAAEADWWKQADLGPVHGLWGGEVAAARLTKDLVPQTVTIYVRGNPGPLIAAHRLKPDPKGPVQLLEAFWEEGTDEQEGGLVPPLLVYADLLDLGDPRTVALAKVIHDQHLA